MRTEKEQGEVGIVPASPFPLYRFVPLCGFGVLCLQRLSFLPTPPVLPVLQEIAIDGFDKAKKFTARQLAEEPGYNLDQCGYPHEEEEILDPLDLIQRYEEQRALLNAELTAKQGGNKDEQ